MMKFRSEPGSVFDRVFYRKEAIIVEKSGEPRAVIVSVREYEDMKRRRDAAKARFFEFVDEIRANTAQVDPAELQAAIDEAVEAVRREKHR
ncbi:MAG: type II toxin-antitoxin system prevent-host-death family antitoxin [Anaerolineae bacterium]